VSSLAHEPVHEALLADRSKQHVWPAPHGVVGQSMLPPLELPLPEPLPLELPLPEPLPLELPLPEPLPLELPLPELLPLELPLPELLPLELPLPEPLPLELPLPELLPLELPLPEPLPLELPLPPPEPLPLLVAASAASESGIEKLPVPSKLSPHATAEIAQATATDRPRKTRMLHGIVRGKRPLRSPAWVPGVLFGRSESRLFVSRLLPAAHFLGQAEALPGSAVGAAEGAAVRRASGTVRADRLRHCHQAGPRVAPLDRAFARDCRGHGSSIGTSARYRS
jgi:hypothetical protein